MRYLKVRDVRMQKRMVPETAIENNFRHITTLSFPRLKTQIQDSWSADTCDSRSKPPKTWVSILDIFSESLDHERPIATHVSNANEVPQTRE